MIAQTEAEQSVTDAIRGSRINIPLATLNLSGGIKVLIVIANELAAAGASVTLMVPDFAAESPFALHPQVKTSVYRTGSFLPLVLRRAAHYLRLCFSAARECDLVLANYYPTVLCAWISRMLRGRKARVLWYLQGHEAGSHGLLADANWLSRRARYLVASVAYQLPVRLICVSQWVKDNARRPDASIIHPPALNIAAFTNEAPRKASGDCVIGIIGRAEPAKGYDVFLKAAALIPPDSGVHFLVACLPGSNMALPPGRKAERVIARDESEMAAFYRRCDIFLVASRMESFALPGLEAMASGCSVALTACGGVAEYARTEKNCLVVPADDPPAMAAAMMRLVQRPELRAALAAAGRETASHFAPEIPLRRFLNVVAEELGAG